jgi:hypothetical protein
LKTKFAELNGNKNVKFYFEEESEIHELLNSPLILEQERSKFILSQISATIGSWVWIPFGAW